jgi:hypothetical protein
MKMTIPVSSDQTTYDDWVAWANRVKADLEKLNEEMNEAAIENDLCPAYETFLANLRLQTFELEPRQHRYEVTVRGSFYVNAKNEHEADTLARRALAAVESGAGDDWVKGRIEALEGAGFEWSGLYTEEITED